MKRDTQPRIIRHEMHVVFNMETINQDAANEQERIRLRAGRLDREWEKIRESISETSLIRGAMRDGDVITCHVKRTRSDDYITIRFKFPDDYPWSPPYWDVDSPGLKLPELDWLSQDPFQGGYGPSCSLHLMCECIVEMTYKTVYGLKDYKKRV